MKRETEEAREAADEGIVVPLVQAHTLRVIGLGARPADWDARHGRREQLAVMPLRTVHGDPDWDAATVGKQTALGASFGPIRGVWAGFFPRRAEPSSWLRPSPTTASRCRAGGRSSATRVSRILRRRPPSSTPESGDAPTKGDRSRSPSTRPRGTLCAQRRGSRPSPRDPAHADCGTRADASWAEGAKAPSVATAHLEFASRRLAIRAPPSHPSPRTVRWSITRQAPTEICSKCSAKESVRSTRWAVACSASICEGRGGKVEGRSARCSYG